MVVKARLPKKNPWDGSKAWLIEGTTAWSGRKRNRGGMVGLATRLGGGNGTVEVWWGLLPGWGRNREQGRYGRACYRNKEKRRRNGGACYKAGEGNTEQGRYGGHATIQGREPGAQ